MRILYYDCFSGISGDMNLGAMIDLGVDSAFLTGELSKLGLDGEYSLKIEKGTKNGITGTKVNVTLTHSDVDVILTHRDTTHGENDVSVVQEKDRNHHASRHLNDIKKIIEASSLSDCVKKSSMDMFMRIASAEAKVHGKPIDEIHFHEVGAVDSIIDIVGAAIAFDFLHVDKIISSPVQVGGGFVKCAHGLLPVPGPATVEILQGVPLRFGVVPFETTTPTGAAILAVNAESFTEKIEFTIEKTGYGLGNRDLEIPNVLRVYLGTADSHEESKASFGLVVRRDQFMIETNIDDMNPEMYPYIEEKLLEAGALDVYMTPIIMKKGRPAIKLSILADQATEKAVMDILFQETTTLGIRKFGVEKEMLPRKSDMIMTKYGEIAVKYSYYNGKDVKYKAEYERCKTIAKDRNIPIAAVYKEVDIEINRKEKGLQ